MRKISAVLLFLLAAALFLAAQTSSECPKCDEFKVPDACQQPRPATPSEVLAALQAGNVRFTGTPQHRGQSRACVTGLLCCQKPFAIVLSCADSRIPPEVIFDQGIGDLFVVRVAGNVAGKVAGKVVTPAVLGSIEYAVDHGTNTIVVLGHQRCGAVEAAFGARPRSPNLGAIWDLIRPVIPKAPPKSIPDGVWEKAVKDNVGQVVEYLGKNLHVSNKPTIRGAYFSLASGEVELPIKP